MSVNINPRVEYCNWQIKRTSPNSVEDAAPIVTNETQTTEQFTLSSGKSELFEVTLTVTSYTGYIFKKKYTMTSNAPSPNTGTLSWTSSDGSHGETTNGSHGETLTVANDNVTINMSYSDKAGAALNNIGYRIVTAANRVLNGSTVTVNRADCSRGFLKVRMSDACGTATEMFTIPVNVSGSYYAIDIMKDGDIVFSPSNGTPTSQRQAAKSNNLTIGEITILDSRNNIIRHEIYTDNPQNRFELNGLAGGSYTAIISDGKGYTQNIPFVVE